MPVPPPASLLSTLARESALDGLDAEIVAEQASALARAGRRLESALAELSDFADARGDSEMDRSELLSEARTALWCLIVQREACGFRNTPEVMAAYRVPVEVSREVAHSPLIWRRR